MSKLSDRKPMPRLIGNWSTDLYIYRSRVVHAAIKIPLLFNWIIGNNMKQDLPVHKPSTDHVAILGGSNSRQLSILQDHQPDLEPFEKMLRKVSLKPRFIAARNLDRKIITSHINALGSDVTDKVGGHGVAGLLKTGTFAIRAGPALAAADFLQYRSF